MSRENVEIVRTAFEAWADGGIEALLPFYAEDTEWHSPPELPDADIHRGREAVAALWRDFKAGGVFDLKFDLERTQAVGDEVFVVTKGHGQGVRSGTPSEGLPVFWVVLVRGAQIARTRVFLDRAEALEAVGLLE